MFFIFYFFFSFSFSNLLIFSFFLILLHFFNLCLIFCEVIFHASGVYYFIQISSKFLLPEESEINFVDFCARFRLNLLQCIHFRKRNQLLYNISEIGLNFDDLDTPDVFCLRLELLMRKFDSGFMENTFTVFP